MFTMYGLVAALAGWASGVLASKCSVPNASCYRRERLGRFAPAVRWCGAAEQRLSADVRRVCVAGVGYPLFIYSFVVLMAQTIDPAKLASAMGWFWAAYSFGIGVFGAYLPSFTIPMVGEYYSLWLSLPFSIAGLLICLLMVPKSKGSGTSSMSNADKLREQSRSHHSGA